MIGIRHAKKSDISSLVQMDREAAKETSWWKPMSKSDFSKLVDKKNLLFVAESNGFIGYLSGSIKEDNIILENVYVKKAFREKGIANMLIKKFISIWKDSKYNIIRLNCPKRLETFYLELGFKTTSLVMKKDIKK